MAENIDLKYIQLDQMKQMNLKIIWIYLELLQRNDE